jgi:hypothetical protein
MIPSRETIVLVLSVLALALSAFALWRSGGSGHRRRSRSGGEGARTDERGGDVAAGATGMQIGNLARKVSEFEKTLDRHAQQAQALRAEVWQRMDALERRQVEAERRASAPRRDPPPEQPRPAPSAVDYGVETYGLPLRDLAPAANPGASGRPVEVRDGALVISHSLPPAAYAVPEGQGRARVFLNESVEINEFALPKWEAFFEMRGARPYATYRTVRPAEVSWDAAAERGSPLNAGVAEAV